MVITKVRATKKRVLKALGAGTELDTSGVKNLMFNGSKVSYRGQGWWRVAAYTKESLAEAVNFMTYMGGN